MKIASDLAIKLNISNEVATAVLSNVGQEPQRKYVLLERLGLKFTQEEIESFGNDFEKLLKVVESKVKPKPKRKPRNKKPTGQE